MNMSELGRLQKVSLRDAWASEAGDFTPWLALPANLRLVGEAIGMELELVVKEKYVGPYRADLLCRELTSEQVVLIENQLERTDHVHLGQLLTYAAGLEAVNVVWIAGRFTEEHRAALDWLNEKTPEDINFFGLEVELWRIGDSPVAPKFNVVCKPNEWTRTVKASTDNSENNEFCRAYWSGVLQALEPAGILLPTAKPKLRQDMVFDVGWHSFRLKAYFSRAKKVAGVWVSCRGLRGFENFQLLQNSSSQIEAAYGAALEWEPYPAEQRGTCIELLQGVDANDTTDWPRQHQLLAEKVGALYRALNPLVQPLDVKAEEIVSE